MFGGCIFSAEDSDGKSRSSEIKKIPDDLLYVARQKFGAQACVSGYFSLPDKNSRYVVV